jgi:hypothetical protein
MLHAKPVRRSSVLLPLAFLCSLGPSAAADLQEQAVDYYSVEFRGKFRDGRGIFDLHVVCNERSAEDLPTVKFLGVDTDKPACVVRVISFSLNGKEVFLPAKSYTDLANVSIGGGVYVTTRGNLVVLHVHGGDGESAYKTRYLIKGHELVAREVEELNAAGEPSITKQTYEGNKPENPHKKR